MGQHKQTSVSFFVQAYYSQRTIKNRVQTHLSQCLFGDLGDKYCFKSTHLRERSAASYLSDGFGPGHAGKTHVVLGFPPQNIEFLPVDFHLERVVLYLLGRLGFSDLVSKAPLSGCLPHL